MAHINLFCREHALSSGPLLQSTVEKYFMDYPSVTAYIYLVNTNVFCCFICVVYEIGFELQESEQDCSQKHTFKRQCYYENTPLLEKRNLLTLAYKRLNSSKIFTHISNPTGNTDKTIITAIIQNYFLLT